MVRPRGRPNVQPNPEPENNERQDMQQVLRMLAQQQTMITDLREEVRELREKRNADEAEPEGNNLEGNDLEGNAGQEQPPENEQSCEVHPEIPVYQEREEDTIQYWMPKFIKYQPEPFHGKFNPQAAENWINHLEKIFDVLGCPTEMKARMAIYKLQGDADDWWKNIAFVLRARHIPLTWELFLEKFYENYFPRSVMREKEKEFLAI